MNHIHAEPKQQAAMKYPANFAKDMRELSAYYEWDQEEKDEFRAAFTNCEPMVRYLTILAAAHRAGYSQHAGNGFVRLQTWCIDVGIGDPFGPEFDVAALDALEVAPRKQQTK